MFCSFRIRPAAVALAALLLAGALTAAAVLRPEPNLCTNAILAAAEPMSDTAENSTAQDQNDKVAYLTFDDGPSKNTEPILAILKEYNIKATFFVCAAENNETYLPALSRIVADGHQIGLHSCTHNYKKIYSSPDAYWEDLDQLWAKISVYVNIPRPVCIRFPGGATNTISRKCGGAGIMEELRTQAVEKGYRYFDWNVSPGDAEGGSPSAQTLHDRVMKQAKGHNRIVILLHDTAATSNTVKALPDILADLTAEGFRFDIVSNYGSSAAQVSTPDSAAATPVPAAAEESASGAAFAPSAE